MTHTKRRKKYDQIRTPWKRICKRTRLTLDAAWAHIQSVPYKVSSRWLFYRLLQDGFYKTKEDYKDKFEKMFSRARHTNQDDWRPDTLVDEGRAVIPQVIGFRDEPEAFEAMKKNIQYAAYVPRDHFFKQKNYIELWFEAEAMSSQFQHYTKDKPIDLVPMAGSTSISFKWDLAQRLDLVAVRYGKPIVILYFGDEDKHGHVIQTVIEKDVRRWCRADFDLIWCGLTMDQVRRYKVPKNFAKPGYQWEALPDEGAGEIITTAIRKYIDLDLIKEAEIEVVKFADLWRKRIEKILKKTDRRN